MIVVVGLSHRTATIEVREALAIGPDDVASMLRQAVDLPPIGEALLISTCNRVELVTAARTGLGAALEDVARASTGLLARRAPDVARHLYCHSGGAAVRHLFRVAASLDSLVLGEPQILGQVKQAFETAQRTGTVGNCLHRAVTRAIRAAKRVRTETTIGTGQVSVPSVAVDLAKQIFGELKARTVLLVGSGEMAETVARLLQHGGCRLLVTGRNESRVATLARTVGAEGRSWQEIGAALVEADVVVTSTSAPHFVIGHDAVKATRKARRGRTLFFIDLAVPRDVDPQVARLDGVFLYNVDDFSHIVAESISARQKEAERADRIIHEEATGYDRWAESIQVTPTIVALRERFQRTMHSELERSLRGRLKHLGVEDRAALSKMIEAVVNKLLHEPTTRLRQAAVDGALDERSHDALIELFGIDRQDEPGAVVRNLKSLPAQADAEDEDGPVASHETALGTTRR